MNHPELRPIVSFSWNNSINAIKKTVAQQLVFRHNLISIFRSVEDSDNLIRLSALIVELSYLYDALFIISATAGI